MSRPGKCVRPTARDLLVLQQISKYHAVTVPLMQQSLYYGLARSTVSDSLKRLVKAGLLEDLQAGPSNLVRPNDTPALYVATKAGFAFANSPLKCGPVALAAVHHTLAVAQIGLVASRNGDDVIADREMKRAVSVWRASGQTATPANAPWVASDQNYWVPSIPAWPTPGGRIETHIPDLVITRPNGTTEAHEIELSKKSPDRVRETLQRYAATNRYDAVVYQCTERSVAAHVVKVAKSLPPAELPKGLRFQKIYPAWR